MDRRDEQLQDKLIVIVINIQLTNYLESYMNLQQNITIKKTQVGAHTARTKK